MAKVKSKLGCASSLFQCFGSKKERAAHNAEQRSSLTTDDGPHELRVRFMPPETCAGRPSSPLSHLSSKSDRMSICSGTSKSSVYLDALEDHPDYDSDEYSLDSSASSFSLQIDGQYFFTARDDALTSNAFDSINMYPPVPSTGPDALNRYPVSSSDMQSLLYKYQHSDVSDGEEKKEAKVHHELGKAMEHQARALMSVTPDDTTKAFESTNILLEELKLPNIKVGERGYPGELTSAELEAVKLFKNELESRDPIYYTIVRSFASVEKEAYALCRFLRARKFDVHKVFELLDEAKEGFSVAKENGFYPDLEEALGFPRPVFLSQYPAVFSGNARNGCPVMYLRAGSIQPEGVKVKLYCLYDIHRVVHRFISTNLCMQNQF